MTHLAIQPTRRCGKSIWHLQQVEMLLLNALFDAPAPMSVTDLETALDCIRRDIWQAIQRQRQLGNIKKGQPIELTASARIAMAAARLAFSHEHPGTRRRM